MAKKILQVLKLNLPAGTATPAPPVGPILGQAGINMMDFIKQYNEKTADKRGQVIPAEITVYHDRSFSFVLKLPPVSDMIKQMLKLGKGSSKTGREPVGKLTMEQVKTIATQKLADLNTTDVEQAAKTVMGTASSMGVTIAE